MRPSAEIAVDLRTLTTRRTEPLAALRGPDDIWPGQLSFPPNRGGLLYAARLAAVVS